MTDQEKIAEFLARKGATKCASGEAKAKSLRRMARDFDRANLNPRRNDSEWLWEMGFVQEARDLVRRR